MADGKKASNGAHCKSCDNRNLRTEGGLQDHNQAKQAECLGHLVTLSLATFNELHAMLKLHEQTLALPKSNTPALHATKGLRASRRLKPGALSLYVSNGQREAVEAIGFFIYDYALETVACILNMVPTKKIEKTPYEVWHVQAPKLSYLKVLSCEALVKQDTLNKLDKLEPRSINYIFVGYLKEIMHYSFYYPSENRVIVAQNANFLENSRINKEASGRLEDLEIIQEEDTHPSIDTSLHHEEDDLEMNEPQIYIIPIHRSTRIRHALDHMCLYVDAEEHELRDISEPTNYKAALLDPKSDKWLDAMNVKMQSMKDNEVWDLVKLLRDSKTIGSKWLFKKKTGMDRAVHTYKARLVVKVYTQTLRIDYEETFSPVSKIRAIWILIAIATFYEYEIWQMDVKTAILNVYLSKEFCMEQPKGFVNPKYPNQKLSILLLMMLLRKSFRPKFTTFMKLSNASVYKSVGVSKAFKTYSEYWNASSK
uniref:Uncharacterized protein n=1 Tax=Tanacetum cinerariifolium TaxID=118510 RepID=A0A6L2JCI9_TANCI|nr:hypothetical protein [Tanacetum cinerariifolium]